MTKFPEVISTLKRRRAWSVEEKVEILHYMEKIGIDSADIGLPGAGPHVQRSVERLARAAEYPFLATMEPEDGAGGSPEDSR